jgi:hypothetical protein
LSSQERTQLPEKRTEHAAAVARGHEALAAPSEEPLPLAEHEECIVCHEKVVNSACQQHALHVTCAGKYGCRLCRGATGSDEGRLATRTARTAAPLEDAGRPVKAARTAAAVDSGREARVPLVPLEERPAAAAGGGSEAGDALGEAGRPVARQSPQELAEMMAEQIKAAQETNRQKAALAEAKLLAKSEAASRKRADQPENIAAKHPRRGRPRPR